MIALELPTGTGAKGALTCYSSFEPYELADYLAAIAAVEPDLAIRVIRMPTAHLAAALLDRGALPQADMVFGWAATAASPEITRLFVGGRYQSPTGFSTAFCLDRALLQSREVAEPRRWHDLASPAVRQLAVMPDPSVSGAGFLAVTTVLQRYGDADGWSLLKDAFAGMPSFAKSAWEPAAGIGAGDKAVGVTVRIAAVQRARQNLRVSWSEPLDAVGCEPEVYAVLSSCSNMAAAERVMDWIMSEDAVPLYQKHAKTVFGSDDGAGSRLAIDVERAMATRAAVLQRWQQDIAGVMSASA